jgi:hypothetical protein
LTIPIDLASAPRDDSIGMPFSRAWLWNILIVLVSFNLFFMIPLANGIYNSKSRISWVKKIWNGVIWSSVVTVVGVALLLVTYYGIGETSIPYRLRKGLIKNAVTSQSILVNFKGPEVIDIDLKLTLSFWNCWIIAVNVIGTTLWCIVGGFGMAMFPIENITKYMDRPQKTDAEELILSKLLLRQKNEALLKETKEVKRKTTEYNKATGYNQRRKLVMSLRTQKNDLRDKFIKHEEVVNIVNTEDFVSLILSKIFIRTT